MGVGLLALLVALLLVVAAAVSAGPDGRGHSHLFQPRADALLWVSSKSRTGYEVSRVLNPTGILHTPDAVFVSSFMTNEVVRMARDPATGGVSHHSRWTAFASHRGLDGPWGLAARDNQLYVASFATDEIQRYNLTTGEFISSFGTETQLNCPEGIAFDPLSGDLFVASFLDNRVARYTADGAYLGEFVARAHGLQGPESLAFDGAGSAFVTSHFDDTVWVFGRDGQGRRLAAVQKPVGLTVGEDGNVYVTSYTSNTVLCLDAATGAILGEFAARKALRGPSAVAFANPRELYVTSYDNNRIVLFNSTDHVSMSLRKIR